MATGGLIQTGAALGQAGYGIYQYQQAKKGLEQLGDRPEYEIPAEIYENLSIAERQALEGLPAEQKKQYIQNIERQSAAALGAGTSRKAGLANVGSVLQSQTDAQANLLAMDAQARREAQQLAMQQRSVLAGQKAQQWQINQLEPYLQSYAELKGEQQVGEQNVMGGVQALAQQEADRQRRASELVGAAIPAITQAATASDIRLKTNIVKTGYVNGINYYKWDWNALGNEIGLYGSSQGVIAQEVAKTNPSAVTTKDGYLAVYYQLLPIS